MLDLRTVPLLDPTLVAEWEALRIGEVLAAFDPVIVSSLASGLGDADSDFDIVCDLRRPGFMEAVDGAFQGRPNFATWTTGARTLVTFDGPSLTIELVGERRPVEQQAAYVHAVAQRRLALLGGAELRRRVRTLRHARTLKTEPAIALLLGLYGDPYEAVAELATAPDARLIELLTQALG